MIAQHATWHSFIEPYDPLWIDEGVSGGLAFGDRAGGASHLSRYASQPSGRSSTGPACDYCGAHFCACEDRFTFEYLTTGDRA